MTPLEDSKAEEYALKIQKIVNQLKKTSKKALAENAIYLVSHEEAKIKYGGRVGETFYLFPNEAPSQEIIDAYERVKPYYGTGFDAVSFERHLSHRQMTVMFVDGDLVIRRDRNLFIDRLTETNLRNAIEKTKESNQIDMTSAKIFIFPYKSIDFFISDSFEPQLSGRGDHRNPNNWFTIPFCENFNYKAIKEQCRKFVNAHPMGNEMPKKENTFNNSCFDSIEEKSEQLDYASHINNLPESFVAIDFETLYSQRVSVCSIGMVKYKDGEIVDRYYSLIRPPFDYEGKSGKALTWVHGISKEMLINEKTFAELLPEIESFISGLPLVAHNASVEKCCIRDVCAYYGIETNLDYNNIIDTLPLSKEIEAKNGEIIEGQGTHSLDAVCSRFGVEVKNHHNALDDAEMCGNLMIVFLRFFTGNESSVNSNKVAKSSTNKEIVNESIDTLSPNTVQSSKGGCLGIFLLSILTLLLL